MSDFKYPEILHSNIRRQAECWLGGSLAHHSDIEGGSAGLHMAATEARDRSLVLRDMRDGLIWQEVARDVCKLDSVALAG